jgi:hypothetical protein
MTHVAINGFGRIGCNCSAPISNAARRSTWSLSTAPVKHVYAATSRPRAQRGRDEDND